MVPMTLPESHPANRLYENFNPAFTICYNNIAWSTSRHNVYREVKSRKQTFYYYNSTGTLFLSYSDGNGGYTDHAYVFYSLREAIQKFRREYGLQRKHIRVIKLY